MARRSQRTSPEFAPSVLRPGHPAGSHADAVGVERPHGGGEAEPGISADEPPTIDIVLKTRLKDIPEAEPCEVCGSPTAKAFVEHVSRGDSLRVRARRTAGYRCQNSSCGVVAFSPQAFIESLTLSSQILRDRGDLATAAAFEQRIEIERRLADDHRVEKAQPAYAR